MADPRGTMVLCVPNGSRWHMMLPPNLQWIRVLSGGAVVALASRMKRISAAGLVVMACAGIACGGLVRPIGPDGPDGGGPNFDAAPPPLPSPPSPFPPTPPGPTALDGGPSPVPGPFGGLDAGSSPDSSAPFIPGTNGPDAGPADPLTCYSPPGLITTTWNGPALAHRNLCTPEDIAGIFAACYGPNASDQACLTFSGKLANSACTRCVVGYTPTNGQLDGVPQPAVVSRFKAGMQTTEPNKNACAAAVLGLSDCGPAMTDLHLCEAGSCFGCGASDYDACIARAESRVCAPLIADSQASCLDPIAAGSATWEAACGVGAPTFEAAFTAVTTTMCGL